MRAFELLGEYLEEDGWHPQRVEERTIYRVGYSGENGMQQCFAQVLVEMEQLLFYAFSPIKVPEDRRAAAAEFLTRANYGLRIGNFEMDYKDGEVRYKSSVDFEGVAVTHALVRNAIYPAVRTMDDYMSGLLAVAFGGQDPEEAIAEIEA
jgi:hypothetical protein